MAATQTVYLDGKHIVLTKLLKQRKLWAAGVGRGLKKLGLLIQRGAQQNAPVEFGPMKASAYTRNIGGTGLDTIIAVGFTSLYAGAVHQRVKMAWKGRKRMGKTADGRPHKGRYWDPKGKGTALFLLKSVQANLPKAIDIVGDEARKGGGY